MWTIDIYPLNLLSPGHAPPPFPTLPPQTMVTRRTTPKAKAAAMLKSFEADYKTACKTKNPQMLEKYFKDLSDDHLKQLCNSANIDARKRETRIAALAAALLKRKTTTQKALRVMTRILRFFGAIYFVLGVSDSTSELRSAIRERRTKPLEVIAMLCTIVFGSFATMDMVSNYIKSRKQFGTTKASRRLLRQMRALHTVRAPSKTSKTKKSS